MGFALSGELHKTTLTTDWPIYLTTSADKRLLARRRLSVPSVFPTMKNPRHAPDVCSATGWYHNDTEHNPDRYLFYT